MENNILDNKNNKTHNKLDLSTFLKDLLKEIGIDFPLCLYIREIWKDLTQRDSKLQGVSKLTFSSYYSLPGIINDRIFKLFDIDKDGYLNEKEFVSGFTLLFSDNSKVLSRLIFELYDFNDDGRITKNDIKVIFSYFPLNSNNNKNKMKQLSFENEEYKKRISSQEDLQKIINKSFENRESLNYIEFCNVIINKCSEIFLFLMVFLFDRKPFTGKSLVQFSLSSKLSEKRYIVEYYKKFIQQVASSCNYTNIDNSSNMLSNNMNFLTLKAEDYFKQKKNDNNFNEKNSQEKDTSSMIKTMILPNEFPSFYPSQALSKSQALKKSKKNYRKSIHENAKNNSSSSSSSNSNIFSSSSDSENDSKNNEINVNNTSDVKLDSTFKSNSNNINNSNCKYLPLDLNNIKKCLLKKEMTITKNYKKVFSLDNYNSFNNQNSSGNISSNNIITSSQKAYLDESNVSWVKSDIDLKSGYSRDSSFVRIKGILHSNSNAKSTSSDNDNYADSFELKQAVKIKTRTMIKLQDTSLVSDSLLSSSCSSDLWRSDSEDDDDGNIIDKSTKFGGYLIKLIEKSGKEINLSAFNNNNSNININNAKTIPYINQLNNVNNNITNNINNISNINTISNTSTSFNGNINSTNICSNNFNNPNLTTKKIYFKLIYRDFYFYKKEQDVDFKGIHHLSGVFINEEPNQIIKNINYFCFSIAYPNKKKFYLCENQNDYNNWIKHLRITTGYFSLTDKYEIKETLGKGRFGVVKLGINKPTNQQVAIKILRKNDMTEEDKTQTKQEIEILKVCQHPNIIRFYEAFENDEFFYLIMEYCSGNDLFTYLEIRHFKLTEKQACLIIQRILSAIYYIHSFGIVHRDIKPENILMTTNKENATPKILDFGLSKIIAPDEFCVEPYGTLMYVAPEILESKPYNMCVDLWSIGVISYLLLTGILPFDCDETKIVNQILNENVQYPDVIWGGINIKAKEFVNSKYIILLLTFFFIIFFHLELLVHDYKKRISIESALTDSWILSFPENNLDLESNKSGINSFNKYAFKYGK